MDSNSLGSLNRVKPEETNPGGSSERFRHNLDCNTPPRNCTISLFTVTMAATTKDAFLYNILSDYRTPETVYTDTGSYDNTNIDKQLHHILEG
jgi:hypothetical protein